MKLHTTACGLSHRSRRVPPALVESTSRPVARPLHVDGTVSVSAPAARSPGSRPFAAASQGYQFPYHDANAPSAPTATLRAIRARGARMVNRISATRPLGTRSAYRTRALSRDAEKVAVAPAASTVSKRIPSGASTRSGPLEPSAGAVAESWPLTLSVPLSG